MTPWQWLQLLAISVVIVAIVPSAAAAAESLTTIAGSPSAVAVEGPSATPSAPSSQSGQGSTGYSTLQFIGALGLAGALGAVVAAVVTAKSNERRDRRQQEVTRRADVRADAQDALLAFRKAVLHLVAALIANDHEASKERAIAILERRQALVTAVGNLDASPEITRQLSARLNRLQGTAERLARAAQNQSDDRQVELTKQIESLEGETDALDAQIRALTVDSEAS